MLFRFSHIFGLCFLILATSCGPAIEDPVAIPKDAKSLDRGRELVKGLAACGFCHGQVRAPDSVMSGGREFHDRYGTVIASNITPSRSGIRDWTPLEYVRAIRSFTRPDEEEISKEAHSGYEWMSDEDLLSIIAYLRSIPPVENLVEKRSIDFFTRNIEGFTDSSKRVFGYVPAVDQRFGPAYGAYLVDNVARCGSCHNTKGGFFTSSEYLGGGETIENEHGEETAPNITASTSYGIGSWTEDDIVNYLKTAKTPDRKKTNPNFCPTTFYKNTPDTDLRAIAKHLRTLQ